MRGEGDLRELGGMGETKNPSEESGVLEETKNPSEGVQACVGRDRDATMAILVKEECNPCEYLPDLI